MDIHEDEYWQIFKPPVDVNSTEKYEYMECKETNVNVSDLTRYEFVSKDLDAFHLPAKSFILVKGKVLRDDNTPFAGDTNIALVNNGFAIFQKAYYLINDQLCEEVDYCHQATTVISLINWSDDYTRSAGTSALWYKDTGNGKTDRNRYITTSTEAADVITSVTMDNANYNMGHTMRAEVCKEGNLVTIMLPLSHVFGFFNDINKVFRGVRHTVKLVRNDDKNIIYCAAGIAGNPKFKISNMSWWIPILRPDLTTLARIENELLSKSSKLYWQSMNMYRSEAKRDASPAWRITTSNFKPVRLYVVFQHTDKVDTYTGNNAVFDHMNLERIHVRINNHQFPLEEYTCDFTDKINDYNRVYHSFLEAGLKYSDVDSGSQVSYSEFKSLYPIFHFDVSKHEENLFQVSGMCDIELRLNLRTVPTADYHIYCLILYDRLATLQGVGGRMNIIL